MQYLLVLLRRRRPILEKFMPLEEAVRNAKSLGLSYGQYIARYRSDEHIEPKKKSAVLLRIDKYEASKNISIKKKAKMDVDKLVKMYGAGDSLKEMSEVLGCTEIEMARFISKAGLTRTDCGYKQGGE